ncbi:MAG: FtsX-like permease family protein [bacterium]|nr:FtsX-like permease family protein [bacterium]
MKYIWSERMDDWKRDVRFHTYIQLRENSSGEDVSRKIAGVIKKYLPGSTSEIFLQPLTDIYLRSNFRWDNDGMGNIDNVYIFILAAICILLIACINFMNLSTARAGNRTKEIGIRKVVGAYRKDLIKQFFGESIILAFIALLFGIILAYLFLPIFEFICGGELVLSTDFPGVVRIISGVLGITLLTGIISGIYPALYLSYFQPVSVIKGLSSEGRRRGASLRKFLVVAQFAFAIIMAICTTVIYSQLSYMKNKDLGFNKDNLVYFWSRGGLDRNFEAIKNELLQNSNILGVSKGDPPVKASLWGTPDFTWDGKEAGKEVKLSPILLDYDYLKVLDIEMALGRPYSKEYSTDVSNYILNEAAVKTMGLKSPLGKKMSYTGSRYIIGDDPGEGAIIGVVKDFHHGPMHSQIEPLVFKIYSGNAAIFVKLKPGTIDETIPFIESKWKKFVRGYPFSYHFLDERIDKFYENDRRVAAVTRYSTFLTILIACLGLLGLASFVAEKRTKEIGIRKVLGASVPGIMKLLSKDFIRWVLTANIIAWPLAWYVMNRWLQDFAYRTGIHWWVFVLAGLITLITALVTVSYQTINAAYANPVNSLKYE